MILEIDVLDKAIESILSVSVSNDALPTTTNALVIIEDIASEKPFSGYTTGTATVESLKRISLCGTKKTEVRGRVVTLRNISSVVSRVAGNPDLLYTVSLKFCIEPREAANVPKIERVEFDNS